MLARAIALVVSLGLVAEALAQTPPARPPPASPPTRLRGSITAIDGKTGTIATREDTSVPVTLAENWTVMLVSPMSLADQGEQLRRHRLAEGPDGTLNALEVLIGVPGGDQGRRWQADRGAAAGLKGWPHVADVAGDRGVKPPTSAA